MTHRQILLAVALVATLVATFWPRQEDTGEPAIVESMPARKAAAPKPGAAPEIGSTANRSAPTPTAGTPPVGTQAAEVAPRSERFQRLAGDLFPLQTWAPPPPKPKPYVPPPPPPPAPPALPFTYLGHWAEEGETVYFLTTKADRVYPVRQGEVVMNDWRLDKANEDLLVFTYLPLDMPKTIRIAR